MKHATQQARTYGFTVRHNASLLIETGVTVFAHQGMIVFRSLRSTCLPWVLSSSSHPQTANVQVLEVLLIGYQPIL